MVLTSKSLRLIISVLSKRLLEDDSPFVRAKAARCLGELGTEKAIKPLCQALEQEKDQGVVIAIIDAIMLINKLTSSPLMPEAPKYDFRGSNIGNFADNVEGDQKTVQHNYAQQQNLTEAAKEIQDLIQYLQETNPTTTEEEAVKQVIINNPTLKTRLINALKQGGTEALKVFFPFVSIPLETIRGFIEAE